MINWTTDARKRTLPARGDVPVRRGRRKPSPGALFKSIFKGGKGLRGFGSMRSRWEEGQERDGLHGEEIRQILLETDENTIPARYLKVGELSPSREGTLMAMVCAPIKTPTWPPARSWRVPTAGHPIAGRFIKLWSAVGGVSSALEAAFLADELVVQQHVGTAVTLISSGPRQRMWGWQELRRQLAEAPGDDHELALVRARTLWDSLSLYHRGVMALLFPEQRSWGAAIVAMTLSMEHPAGGILRNAVLLSRDASEVEALLGRSTPVSYAWMAAHATQLLTTLGEDARPLLVKLRETERGDRESVEFALALTEAG